MLLDFTQQGVDALERLGAPPFLTGEGVMQPAVLFFQPGRFHAQGGKLGAKVRVLRPQTIQTGQEFGDTRLKLFQKFHGSTLPPRRGSWQGASSARASFLQSFGGGPPRALPCAGEILYIGRTVRGCPARGAPGAPGRAVRARPFRRLAMAGGHPHFTRRLSMAPYPNTIAQSGASSAVSVYMRHVYQWMTAGLALTTVVAYGVAGTPAIRDAILGNSLVLILLVVAQFGLVIALSAAIHKLSAGAATGLFLLYSALTGAMLSSIFVVYPIASIGTAFLVTTGTFLAMTVYGTVTKRDLTGLGNFLFMGLIGIIIAMVVNIFLQSTMMNFIVSCLGVLIFTGLTAYDTQKLRRFGEAAPLEDGTAIRRGAILGALTLYLDFINIFLMLLQLFGGNRD